MRIIYQGTGMGLVALAMIGAVLPLIPTTPFLLLATACFMRSSPQWNAWLFRTPLFGRALQDWQDHGCIRPQAKIMAIASMAFLGVPATLSGKLPLGISILLLLSTWHCSQCGIVPASQAAKAILQKEVRSSRPAIEPKLRCSAWRALFRKAATKKRASARIRSSCLSSC